MRDTEKWLPLRPVYKKYDDSCLSRAYIEMIEGLLISILDRLGKLKEG